MSIRLTESRLRQIIREEMRSLSGRRILREGEGAPKELKFGQPELETYEDSLEIKFPYTLGGDEDSVEMSVMLDNAKKMSVDTLVNRFIEENLHLAYQADDDLEPGDDAGAKAFILAAWSASEIDMEEFKNDLRDAKENFY